MISVRFLTGVSKFVPDYINVVFGSERVCCLRAAGICAPSLLEWAGQLSAYKWLSERCQECRTIGVELNWAKKGTLARERKKYQEAEHLFSLG